MLLHSIQDHQCLHPASSSQLLQHALSNIKCPRLLFFLNLALIHFFVIKSSHFFSTGNRSVNKTDKNVYYYGPHILMENQFGSVQSFSRVWLFVTPWTAARQASLSITNSQSLLKLLSIVSVMPLSHLILCHLLLLKERE